MTTVEELARTLLDEAGDRRSRVCVVFDFAQVEFSGTNTQHMKLTERDLEELRGFLERLPR